ncbi:MAG: type IV secretion system DNA-binding domain-containing protein [Gammaproteobacteria bacterium]|nr:type IV secretion system DNA-binding domain-containing protein [Gammaproteobacteria bacterium]
MPVRQRGLEPEQEQAQSAIIRDVRTIGQKVAEFFQNPAAVSIVLFSMAIGGFIISGLADFLLVIGIILFLIAKTNHPMLPFRLPKWARVRDYNSPKTGSNKPSLSAGIYFLGNDRKTGDELWFTNEDMRTHVLIFGSTGSGKTESMISLAYNALCQGSGFIFVDGKGDNTVFSKIFSLVRAMGREDDLLLINFMTGARDIIGPQEKRLSNTMNPFASGSSSMLSQLIVSLMDASSEKADADMWKGRAIAFVEALMRVLVAMRDAGNILLDANTIRNYFSLERLESMVLDKLFIRDNQEAVSLEGYPSVILEPIINYLATLPGYNKEKKGKQVSQVYEQHGYITMQLTRVFTSLADTYGHILRTNLPEVDLRDVVLNRRILVVLLPALEKSPDELSNLGKIIIASLKTMMAAGLGEEIEGMYSQIVERKPTNARNPFLCILDEYGYYAVAGFAIVPAQARSLGFSVVFAGQDLPALQRASKEEAATIGANTNIKICMKLEDPMETWEFFMKTAGESYVTHVGGFQTDARSVTGQYMDTRSAQLEKRARIDLLDLKEQREGEAHVFFKSRIVRASMFYANPKPVKELRLNQFVKIDYPTDAVLRSLVAGFENFKKIVAVKNVFANVTLPEDDTKDILALFKQQPAAIPIERGITTLLSYHERLTSPLFAPEQETELPLGELDVFTRLNITDYLRGLLLVTEVDAFGAPILAKSTTREKIAYFERLLGKAEQYANTVAVELVKDMEIATHYPPEVTLQVSVEELVTVANALIQHIVLRKQEGVATAK